MCELLRANLYEFQKYNKESGDPAYFTNARIQRIARQALRSLAFLHSLGLIHSDLKPENILIKSYSRWAAGKRAGRGMVCPSPTGAVGLTTTSMWVGSCQGCREAGWARVC